MNPNKTLQAQDTIAKLYGYNSATHALTLMANASPTTTTLPPWVWKEYQQIFMGGAQSPKTLGNAWGPSKTQRFPKSVTGGSKDPLT